MRATDQKYWLASGAFLSLFIVFLGQSESSDFIFSKPPNDQTLQSAFALLIHIFVFVVGTLVYLMQNWNRAWKEHYLEILHEIRADIFPNKNGNKILPFWLRSNTPEQLVSVDNSLKALVFLINTAVLFVILAEICVLFPTAAGYIAATFALVIYIVVLCVIEKSITRRNHLNA